MYGICPTQQNLKLLKRNQAAVSSAAGCLQMDIEKTPLDLRELLEVEQEVRDVYEAMASLQTLFAGAGGQCRPSGRYFKNISRLKSPVC